MSAAGEPPRGRYLRTLTIAALGVAYGDIGTSPLYALRECFHGDHAVDASRQNVLGVLSLILWSLILVISVKYLGFVLRADNRGEGGILALLALAVPRRSESGGAARVLVLLGLFGAALLYGDGMITPAISVLGAVEGLGVAAPGLAPFVIPVTLFILVLLFLFQSRGTERVGAVFGPITLVWFGALAALGIHGIAREPGVLVAVDPRHALHALSGAGSGFLVLAGVFLVVTGGEALYADMGHFGRRPLRLAWFTIVLPALVLNYFGQGALLLEDPGAVSSPFYRLAPSWALYPLVALATTAACIASQAVISGAFSLTRQAVQLGYCPRISIRHTSEREIGQIYIGPVNWLLLLASASLVVGFGTSSNLAAAYGMSVATTMLITTPLLAVVAWRSWRHGKLCSVAFLAFIVIDAAFFAANASKITHGGWFSLLVGGAFFAIMTTWDGGRRVLRARLRETAMPADLFLEDVARNELPRVAGTAVFLSADPEGTPHALLHNIKHNKVLHERVIFLHAATAEVPYVAADSRATLRSLGHGFYRVHLRFGFMEDPDVPAALDSLRSEEFPMIAAAASYFLGREKLIPTGRSGMARWREVLFTQLADNAESATTYFCLPANRVVEIGAQVEV